MAEIKCAFSGKCQRCPYFDQDKDSGRMICLLETIRNSSSSERARMRVAYEACRSLIDSAPPPGDTDAEEVTDMYNAAERFCESVEALGYGD